MRLKPDMIELASHEERVEFILQQFKDNIDNIQRCSMDSVATYFSHMYNIKFDRDFWIKNLWPSLQQSIQGNENES